MTTLVVTLVCAAAGVAAGSLLTKVVARVPPGRPVLTSSCCDQCDHRLTISQVLPIVSWLALRNRCHWCARTIGLTPLVIELVTPALFLAIGLRLGSDPAVPAYCVLAAGLIALTVIDLQLRRLPREITYVTLAIGAPLLAGAAFLDDRPERVVSAAAGGVLALGLLWLVHLATRGSLGDGDVRLAPLLGCYLGYISLSAVAIGLVAGFTLAAVAGLALVLVRRRNEAYPFGPFLATATLLTLLIAGT